MSHFLSRLKTSSSGGRLCLAISLFFITPAVQGCTSPSPQGGGPVYSVDSPREAQRSFTTIASDALISTRINSKIRSDELVSGEGAQITVRHGVAYLDGTCLDQYQGRMLADLIRTVDGVVGVENRLKPARSGTRFFSANGFVAEKIRLNLQKDSALSRMDIRVNATSHQVVLTGDVGSLDQKTKASAIARSHAGERQIVNQLEILGE